MATTRLYGRKGFTTKKSVITLLAGHEDTKARRGLFTFTALPASDAEKLLAELPPEQATDRWRDRAPTFAELVKVAKSVDGDVAGHRVPAERVDERITLDSIELEFGKATKARVRKLAELAEKSSATLEWVNRPEGTRLVVHWT